MMTRIINKYRKSTLGVVAVWFGMSVPLVVSAVGVSVDLGQSYLVKERLSQALDAAALAAASDPSENAQVIEDKVNDFIEANYPSGKVGFTMDVNVDNSADILYVSAKARLETAFMKVAGVETIDVFAESEVTKEVKSIEVSLVMDVTGSMSTNNNIATLRTAATSFVDIMFERVKDINRIKIGLVPCRALWSW
jgi:Flp pilus assembly protein TadG